MAKKKKINEQSEEQKAEFQKWWRGYIASNDNYNRRGPIFQGILHDFAKKAFYRGALFERRKHEITEVGGDY